jgi:hypothetical protein
MLHLYKKLSIQQLQNTIVVFGMLIAVWIMYIQQGWVNDDSLLYFESARLFTNGEWKSGFMLFAWPLYALLLAGVHKLTALNIELSAQLINVILVAITIRSLLQIIILAGGDKLSLLLAALLLFSSAYIVGDVLPMLLRDQGFWACLLTAMTFLIKFYRQHEIKDAIYWQLLALMAMLFRIEAFTYVVFLPLVLLFQQNISLHNRAMHLLKAHALNLSLVLASSIAVIFHGSLGIADLGRVKEIFYSLSEIQQNFNVEISAKAHHMATLVLGEPLEKFAWMSLILSLLTIVLMKCLSVAGWFTFLISWLNYGKIKAMMAEDVRFILLATALLGFINAVLIIFKVNLLSGRYVIIFGFVLIIFATFAARSALDQWQSNQRYQLKNLTTMLALILISVGLISNILPKNAAYSFEKDAVEYVKKQSPNSKVFYASHKARHYAGEPYIGRFDDYWQVTEQAINDKSIYQYDYLLINFNFNQNAAARQQLLAVNLAHYEHVKTFYGFKNKKAVLVYKKIHLEN